MTAVVNAGVLAVAYEEDGPGDGWPVVLVHGFPYDVHAFDAVVPVLVAEGARVIRPYQRGFGPTRFLGPETARLGQQAALGTDLIALVEALDLLEPIVAGYDWGGLASCVASALWPDRIGGLVSMAGYDIIDIESQKHASDPLLESVMWYQHLFQSERGRECLTQSRRALCRLLWEQWSPSWKFEEATFEQTAKSFDNPDFVDVVVHAYRHHFGLAQGDPSYQPLEDRLATKPKITVPAVTIDGTLDPLKPGGTAHHAEMFVGRHEHRAVEVGHNLPQEAPEAFANTVLTVRRWIR
jgi:pimeloyl-ACP methyl ester carboxylesterase